MHCLSSRGQERLVGFHCHPKSVAAGTGTVRNHMTDTLQGAFAILFSDHALLEYAPVDATRTSPSPKPLCSALGP